MHCLQLVQAAGVLVQLCAQLGLLTGSFHSQELGGKVKYVGGASYLDRIPISFKFADLSHRLAEKANGAVLVKYLVPGEPLDEDELVGIQDDLDIQASPAYRLISCPSSLVVAVCTI